MMCAELVTRLIEGWIGRRMGDILMGEVMGVRSCFTVLLSMLAACLGVAAIALWIAAERQAVVVIVAADAPGYSADQVDDLVATPIAIRLNGIPGVERIRSRATAGKAVVWVDFASGTDVYNTRQATADRLQLAAPELPKAVVPRLGPVLVPDDVMLVALSTDRYSPVQLRNMADGVVRPRLLAIPGVAEVVVTGGLVEQVQVDVDPDKMTCRDLTISELVSAVEKALADDTLRPGKQEEDFLVNTLDGRELEQIVLASRAGRPIYVRDVALVQLGAVPPHRDTSRSKGEAKIPPPAVLLGVLRQPDADAKRLSRQVDEALRVVMFRDLPDHLRVGRQVPTELAPLALQMAEEIQQDHPPEVTFRQETSADLGTVLVRNSPPRTIIAIVGPDREHLRAVARDLADRLRLVPGVADVQADSLEEAPQIRINVDRQKAAILGVALSDILATVEVAQEGRRVGRLKGLGAGQAVDVVVSFAPDMRNDSETFQELSVRAVSGETVALGQLARVETVSVPRSLYRQQMLRASLVSCEVRAGDRAQAMAEIKRTVAAYPLPADYHVEWD
jgi:Cu/Ag efflux pump CusA